MNIVLYATWPEWSVTNLMSTRRTRVIVVRLLDGVGNPEVIPLPRKSLSGTYSEKLATSDSSPTPNQVPSTATVLWPSTLTLATQLLNDFHVTAWLFRFELFAIVP